MRKRVATVIAVVLMMLGGTGATLAESDARDLRVRSFEGYAAFKQGDHERAYAILRPVAEAGHTGAMAQLAYLYEHGLGVEQDGERARYWTEQAERQ